MKKTNNLEELGELIKEEKPTTKKNKIIVTDIQVPRTRIKNIPQGLKIFR